MTLPPVEPTGSQFSVFKAIVGNPEVGHDRKGGVSYK
jgi:hypothetical protein